MRSPKICFNLPRLLCHAQAVVTAREDIAVPGLPLQKHQETSPV